jgi:hypothetical protein
LVLAAPEGVRIALPEDFRTTMQHCASVDRADGITSRLYINDSALHAWRDERCLAFERKAAQYKHLTGTKSVQIHRPFCC